MMAEHIFHPEIVLDRKGDEASRKYTRKLLGALFFDSQVNSYRINTEELPTDARNQLMREGNFRRSDFLITVENLKRFADGDKKVFCLSEELCNGLASFSRHIKKDSLPGNGPIFIALPAQKYTMTSGNYVNGLYISFREAVDGDEKMLHVDDLDFVFQLTVAFNKSSGGVTLSSWEIPIAVNKTLYETLKPWRIHAREIVANMAIYEVTKANPTLSRADAMEAAVAKTQDLFLVVNTMAYIGLNSYLFIFSEEMDFSELNSNARRESKAQPTQNFRPWDEITKSASIDVTHVDLDYRAHELKGPAGGTV